MICPTCYGFYPHRPFLVRPMGKGVVAPPPPPPVLDFIFIAHLIQHSHICMKTRGELVCESRHRKSVSFFIYYGAFEGSDITSILPRCFLSDLPSAALIVVTGNYRCTGNNPSRKTDNVTVSTGN